ncbi:MAG: Mth938-like domain-containing protein [Pseudoprimorskyibacter sp.]|nr:Mth938-like domain-containing protein [Pseudoprimorskyibacter sp.]
MRLNEIEFSDAQPVEGYGPGFFRVGGEPMQGPLCLTPQGTMAWGGLSDRDTLIALAGQVDVLFVGTGSEMALLPQSLQDPLEDAGLGIEVMNSPAACRTYNVLLSEGRRVALAALPV